MAVGAGNLIGTRAGGGAGTAMGAGVVLEWSWSAAGGGAGSWLGQLGGPAYEVLVLRITNRRTMGEVTPVKPFHRNSDDEEGFFAKV